MLQSSADVGDKFTIATGTHGATTIATIDDDSNQAAHLTFDIEGDILFSADTDGGVSTGICTVDATNSSFVLLADKKIMLGNTGEYIVGDGTNMVMASSGNLLITTSANSGTGALSFASGAEMNLGSDTGVFNFRDDGDADDAFKITVAGDTGATTLETLSDAADGHLTILADGDMSLQTASAISMHDTSNNIFEFNVASTRFTMFDDDDTSDWFRIAITTNGASTISTNDDSAAAAHLTLDPDGDINLNAYADVNIPANIGLTLGDAGEKIEGNGTDLFINSSRHLTVEVAGALYLDSTIGSHYIRKNGTTFVSFQDDYIEFDGRGVGFDLVTPTYNATDTDVDFRTGNKQFVTFGSGNIADLNLKFPATSGNFTLLLKQDGSGSRTVAADGWLVFDSAGNAANGSSTVKFAGGSNPTLTTDANHVDIVSFFWDADNEIAYGVASLDFQF